MQALGENAAEPYVLLHSMLCVLHMSLCLCVGHGGGCVRLCVCVAQMLAAGLCI